MEPPVVAVYDANIVYPAPLRDLFIRIAGRDALFVADLFHPIGYVGRWFEDRIAAIRAYWRRWLALLGFLRRPLRFVLQFVFVEEFALHLFGLGGRSVHELVVNDGKPIDVPFAMHKVQRVGANEEIADEVHEGEYAARPDGDERQPKLEVPAFCGKSLFPWKADRCNVRRE